MGPLKSLTSRLLTLNVFNIITKALKTDRMERSVLLFSLCEKLVTLLQTVFLTLILKSEIDKTFNCEMGKMSLNLNSIHCMILTG